MLCHVSNPSAYIAPNRDGAFRQCVWQLDSCEIDDQMIDLIGQCETVRDSVFDITQSRNSHCIIVRGDVNRCHCPSHGLPTYGSATLIRSVRVIVVSVSDPTLDPKDPRIINVRVAERSTAGHRSKFSSSFICSVNTSNNKSCSKKVYMSKTYQAHMSTCGRITRTNKENNLHKLTNSLNTNYV